MPLSLLLIAKFNPDTFNGVITAWHLIAYTVMGVLADIAYKYRLSLYQSEVGEHQQGVLNNKKLGLNFILIVPLLFVVLILVMFYSSSDETSITVDSVVKETLYVQSETVKSDYISTGSKVEELYNAPQEQYVIFTPDLNSDKAVRIQFLTKAIENYKKLSPLSNLTPEEAEKSQSIAKAFYPLLLAGKWEELLEYVDANSADNPEISNVIINVGALSEMPIDIMIELSNRGGIVNPDTLLRMIIQERYADVLTLENFGSDLSTELQGKTNVLHLALLSPLPPKAFDFILSRTGVIDEVGVMGVDTLGVAIINAATNREHIVQYLNYLIDEGATIKKQHKVLMAGLYRDSEKLYNEIVDSIPQLLIEDTASNII